MSGDVCFFSPEKWITECGSKLTHELPPGKEVMYVVQISSILGKLPLVRAGDTGTIPHKYHTATRSGKPRYKQLLAHTDSQEGAGDGCPIIDSNVLCEFVGPWLVTGHVSNHVVNPPTKAIQYHPFTNQAE